MQCNAMQRQRRQSQPIMCIGIPARVFTIESHQNDLERHTHKHTHNRFSNVSVCACVCPRAGQSRRLKEIDSVRAINRPKKKK